MSFVEVGGRGRAGLLAAALIALVCALALPSVASAVEIKVDSTADEPAVLPAACVTAGGKCTLRAAIEVSNGTPLEDDSVTFDENVFEGQLADTIALGSDLPPITDKVRIEGRSSCATEGGFIGPCQGVSGPGPAGSALTVEDTDEVEIEGMAITDAANGLNVLDSSEKVKVQSSWFGIALDGSAGGNTVGVFIDPDSNNGRIGGEGQGTGNIFANNAADGLRILGADETLVLGNWFGVEPDGVTVAGNGEDIEVSSQLAGGFVAEKNLIGVQAPFTEPPTPACDIGCNVIAGATSSGVDLQGDSIQGESPAVETHVAGNFIGLGSDGATEVSNGFAGVTVGAAAKTLVGGLAEDEANFIVGGGGFGVYHENANDLQVLGNEIGFSPDGAPLESPGIGLFIFCNTTTEPATIEGNAIGMDPGGIGIEQRFLGATIAGNFIEGGKTGILTTGNGAFGNLIEENLIEGATSNGILIKTDLNEVVGNEVLGSGGAGIRVEHAGESPTISPTTENLVGGDAAGEENTISGSGGDAIEIVDFEATANEVARNRGSGNAGLFIDLVASDPGTEPNGPNGGIKPPKISGLSESSAGGSDAKEGAVVRVFRKASSEKGEISSFLGEAQADAEGNWKVDFSETLPGNTFVAATQTSKGATSELAISLTSTVIVDGGCAFFSFPGCPGTGGGGGGQSCPAAGPPKCPVTPRPPPATPQTKITKGPKAKSTSTTAKFKFSSSVKGSTFQCKLDKGKFKKCKSPKTYKGLKPGKHVFKVRAVNSAGVADPTPAKKKFTVLG